MSDRLPFNRYDLDRRPDLSAPWEAFRSWLSQDHGLSDDDQAMPPGSTADLTAPYTTGQHEADLPHMRDMRDAFVPQSPMDLGLMAATGPGRMPLKIAGGALGMALQDYDAEGAMGQTMAKRFFSPLVEYIRSLGPKRALTSDQWRDMIKPGQHVFKDPRTGISHPVTPDEAQFSGLDEALRDMGAQRGSFTKSELADEIHTRYPELDMETKGRGDNVTGKGLTTAEADELDSLMNAEDDLTPQQNAREQELRDRMRQEGISHDGPPLYEQYTLPGRKSDYQEHLTTYSDTPRKGQPGFMVYDEVNGEPLEHHATKADAVAAMKRIIERGRAEGWETPPEEISVKSTQVQPKDVWKIEGFDNAFGTQDEAKERLKRWVQHHEDVLNSPHATEGSRARAILTLDKLTNNGEGAPITSQRMYVGADHDAFSPRAGHFDDMPGLLMHSRATRRTLPDGTPVRNVEEIQSDWHQQARDQGGYDTWTPAKQDEWDRLHKKLLIENSPDPTEMERYDALSAERVANQQDRPPQAPLRKNWHEVELKKQLAQAIEDGDQYLTWTTGKQQAQRYNLANYVDKIDFAHNSDGTFTLRGAKGHSDVFPPTKVPDKDLESYVGKEMAEKIREKPTPLTPEEHEEWKSLVNNAPNPDTPGFADWPQTPEFARAQELNNRNSLAGHPRGTIEGQDLQLGGHGMSNFYDRTVVDSAKKLAKQYGGEYTQVPLESSKPISTRTLDRLDDPNGFDHLTQRWYHDEGRMDEDLGRIENHIANRHPRLFEGDEEGFGPLEELHSAFFDLDVPEAERPTLAEFRGRVREALADVKKKLSGPATSVHAIKITPEMREKFKAADNRFSLYADGGRVARDLSRDAQGRRIDEQGRRYFGPYRFDEYYNERGTPRTLEDREARYQRRLSYDDQPLVTLPRLFGSADDPRPRPRVYGDDDRASDFVEPPVDLRLDERDPMVIDDLHRLEPRRGQRLAGGGRVLDAILARLGLRAPTAEMRRMTTDELIRPFTGAGTERGMVEDLQDPSKREMLFGKLREAPTTNLPAVIEPQSRDIAPVQESRPALQQMREAFTPDRRTFLRGAASMAIPKRAELIANLVKPLEVAKTMEEATAPDRSKIIDALSDWSGKLIDDHSKAIDYEIRPSTFYKKLSKITGYSPEELKKVIKNPDFTLTLPGHPEAMRDDMHDWAFVKDFGVDDKIKHITDATGLTPEEVQKLYSDSIGKGLALREEVPYEKWKTLHPANAAESSLKDDLGSVFDEAAEMRSDPNYLAELRDESPWVLEQNGLTAPPRGDPADAQADLDRLERKLGLGPVEQFDDLKSKVSDTLDNLLDKERQVSSQGKKFLEKRRGGRV